MCPNTEKDTGRAASVEAYGSHAVQSLLGGKATPPSFPRGIRQNEKDFQLFRVFLVVNIISFQIIHITMATDSNVMERKILIITDSLVGALLVS